MRTTLVIDDDLFLAARSLAREQSVSIGRVLSDLARKGLRPSPGIGTRNGFPVFKVPLGTKPMTTEDVKSAEDEA